MQPTPSLGRRSSSIRSTPSVRYHPSRRPSPPPGSPRHQVQTFRDIGPTDDHRRSASRASTDMSSPAPSRPSSFVEGRARSRPPSFLDGLISSFEDTTFYDKPLPDLLGEEGDDPDQTIHPTQDEEADVMDQEPTSWIDADPYLETHGFAVLQPLRLLLCVECLYCVPSAEALGHRKDKHGDHRLKQGGTLGFLAWCEKIRAPLQLEEVLDAHPIDPVPPYPLLPIHSGHSCPVADCRKLGTQERKIRQHIRDKHPNANAHPEPAFFQALFSPHRGGYIRVTAPPKEEPVMPGMKMGDIWAARAKEKEAIFNPPIIQDDNAQSSHPFLVASGWAKPLFGKSYDEMTQMHATLEPPSLLVHGMALYTERMQNLCNPASYDARCLISTERYGGSTLRS